MWPDITNRTCKRISLYLCQNIIRYKPEFEAWNIEQRALEKISYYNELRKRKNKDQRTLLWDTHTICFTDRSNFTLLNWNKLSTYWSRSCAHLAITSCAADKMNFRLPHTVEKRQTGLQTARKSPTMQLNQSTTSLLIHPEQDNTLLKQYT